MILRMAWRNIWRNKTRSIVIMLSVVLGLFAGLFVLSLYKGMMKSRISTVIYAETGHLQIHHPLFSQDMDPRFFIANMKGLDSFLAAEPLVKCYSGRSLTQGMLSSTTGSAGVFVFGIDPEKENPVSGLGKKIIEGKGLLYETKNEILIGGKLARKLRLKSGGKVVLTFTDTASEMVASAFRIAGIFETENGPLDERNVFVRKKALDELLGISGEVHEVSLILEGDDHTSQLKSGLQAAFPSLKTEAWTELSPETKLMADTVDIMSLIIVVIIMFALAFGIINTMLMAVLDRTREIGMMMALGLNKWRLFRLVMSETIILTFSGLPFGLLISWMIIERFNRTGLYFFSGQKEMMQSFGFANVIYPEFPFEKISMVLIVVLGTALLSCLFPALKAMKLQPSDALRK